MRQNAIKQLPVVHFSICKFQVVRQFDAVKLFEMPGGLVERPARARHIRQAMQTSRVARRDVKGFINGITRRQAYAALLINAFAFDDIQGGADLLRCVSAMTPSTSARTRCAVFFVLARFR